MKILFVDDLLYTAFSERIESAFSIYVDPDIIKEYLDAVAPEIKVIEKYFPYNYKDGIIYFADVLVLQSAWEAVEYVNRCSSKDLPDYAVIDVDFVYSKKEGDYFPNEFKNNSGSAHLGYKIVKAINDKRSKKCKVIIYTGKEKAEESLAAIKDLNKDEYTVCDKAKPFIDIWDTMKLFLCDSSIEYVKNYGIGSHSISSINQYISKEYDELRAIGDIKIIADCAEIFNLFPMQAHEFLLFTDPETRQAITFFQTITDYFDNNWALCKMFKKIYLLDITDKDYSTPLAAACHGYDWDYNLNKFINGASKDYLFDSKKIDKINNWLNNEMYLCNHTKERIKLESEGNLLEWARNYGKYKNNWESSVAKKIKSLIDQFASDITIELKNEIQSTYLTDWCYLFGNKDSVFGKFIQISINENALGIEIMASELNDNLILIFKVKTLTHCGDLKTCFIGNTLDPVLLKNWGRSWYKISCKDNLIDGKTRYVQYSIWPNVEMESIIIDGDHDPSIELFFEMKNYLKTRSLSS